jgi:hypothetical protein
MAGSVISALSLEADLGRERPPRRKAASWRGCELSLAARTCPLRPPVDGQQKTDCGASRGGDRAAGPDHCRRPRLPTADAQFFSAADALRSIDCVGLCIGAAARVVLVSKPFTPARHSANA